MLVKREIVELSDETIASIFSNVELTDIPEEFIEGVRLTNPDGSYTYLSGVEFKKFISDPATIVYGPLDLALNLDRFSKDVNTLTRRIIEGLNKSDKSNSSSR